MPKKNNDDMRPARERRDVFYCTGPSMTQQSFRNECNINNIMRKALNSGMLPRKRGGYFGDVSGLQMDYHEASNFILEANAQFLALPADLRARFDNDPAKVITFVNDPANAAEAVSLGLLNGVVPPADAARKSQESQPSAKAAKADKSAEDTTSQ